MSRRDGARPQPADPLPSPVMDNHTHLCYETPEDVTRLVEMAQSANVTRVVSIGCELDAAHATIEVARTHPVVKAGVAIHPNEAGRLALTGDLESHLEQFEALAADQDVVVVSETGLDFFRTDSGDGEAIEGQKVSFARHIELAKRLGKPMQIHNREADDATLAMLDECGVPDKTVMHCFSSTPEMARECVERGLYVSFAGNMTFKNAGGLREALLEVPLDRTLVETDAPYLTPMPHRGKPNASYLVPHTVRVMADVRDLPVEEVCEALDAASTTVYGTW